MLLDLWLAALRSAKGIAIQNDNRALLRQHLYKARAEANNPDFDAIVIIMPEKEDELWLVHKDADGIGTNNEGYPKLIYP
jgi:DNA-binding phage protein